MTIILSIIFFFLLLESTMKVFSKLRKKIKLSIAKKKAPTLPLAKTTPFKPIKKDDLYEEPYVEQNESDFNFCLGLFSIFEGSTPDKQEDLYEREFNWETDCEYCEELLEDCSCDHQHESHRDINFGFNCDCEEDPPKKSTGLLDFDSFNVFR